MSASSRWARTASRASLGQRSPSACSTDGRRTAGFRDPRRGTVGLPPMRTDPTDNGGVFIGRRPGTAPVRYRIVPQPSLGARRAFDKLFGASILGVMGILSLAFWGPIPAAWLWAGGRVQHETGSGGFAISVSSVGLLLT